MVLWDEIYFDITLKGSKANISKMLEYLRSGDLDDFFEITEEHIYVDDSYRNATENEECEVIFANEDYGIETDRFDVDEFLEEFCMAAKKLEVYGNIYDCNDDEFSFISYAGDSSYVNSKKLVAVDDELDEIVEDEEKDADD